MVETTHYPTRAAIALLVMLLIVGTSSAQRGVALKTGVLYGYSWLTFNESSQSFDKRLAREKINYTPLQSVGIEMGARIFISSKLALEVVPRWQQWGGTITVNSNEYTNQMLKMVINYQSFRIPATLQYAFAGNERLQFFASLGIGIDYTYRLWFLPTNYYGSAPTQRRTVDIVTPFTSIGFGFTYTPSANSQMSYTFGINYETDALLNPVRFNEFNFWQNSVPLLSHQLHTSFLIQYRL
jgi:hypothetical protein